LAELIIALDVSEEKRLNNLVAALEGQSVWLKFGLEALSAFGYGVIERQAAKGFKVFADVKFHDIPNTVGAAARVLARTGAALFNVHAAGGAAMCGQAREQSEREAAALGRPRPLVVGVTILTSLGPEEVRSVGYQGTPGEAALRLAQVARQGNLDGVVCSVHEAAAVKAACGRDFLTVCPGIRPAGADLQDQKRIATPGGAVEAGADFLVVGRPVTGAPDPAAACAAILDQMHGRGPRRS
jgi:orotidine-5'-phosphate decarboxylase